MNAEVSQIGGGEETAGKSSWCRGEGMATV